MQTTPDDALRPAMHRVVRGGALGIAGIVAGALLNLVLVYVVTRELHSRGAGIFFESIALFSILSTVTAFGADTGFVRTVSRYKALDLVHDIRRLLIVGFLPVVVLSTLAAAAVALWAPDLVDLLLHDDDGDTARYLRLLAPFIPFATVGWVCLAAARGFGSMLAYVSLESVGKPLLRPALALAAIAAGLGAGAIAIAWAIPVAIQLPIALWIVAVLVRRAERDAGIASESSHRPLREIAVEFWRFSLARGVASIFQVSVMWLDVLLVGAMLGPAEAGVYAVVSRLTLAGRLTLEAIRLAIAPEMSALLARGDNDGAGRLYRVAAVWTIAPSWPAYVLLFIFAPVVMRIFGADFTEGTLALQILSASMLFNLGTGEVTTVLLMGGKSSWNLFNNSVSLALNVTLNLLLIPRLGIEGAAIAWTLSILWDNIAPLVQLGVLMRIRLFGRAYFHAVAYPIACYGGFGLGARWLLGESAGALLAAAVAGTAAYGALLYRSRDLFRLPVLWDALRPGRGRKAAEPGEAVSPEPERV